MRLDGVDDRVEYGGSDVFQLRDSFAIAILLRTDPDAAKGTTRLIFGDTANLGRQLLDMLDVQLVALCDVDRWQLNETKRLEP